MLDSQLYAMLTQYLVTAAPLRGVTNSQYLLRPQPAQQGRPDGRSVWMSKISDRRVGWRKMTHKWDGAAEVRTEVQAMETTLQFSVTQPPMMDAGELSHGDVLKIVAGAIQSDDAQKFFIGAGASVLRVTDVRTIYPKNDRDQFEESPTFDVTFKHNDTFVDGVAVFDTFEFRVIAVPNIA